MILVLHTSLFSLMNYFKKSFLRFDTTFMMPEPPRSCIPFILVFFLAIFGLIIFEDDLLSGDFINLSILKVELKMLARFEGAETFIFESEFLFSSWALFGKFKCWVLNHTDFLLVLSFKFFDDLISSALVFDGDLARLLLCE